MSQYKGGGQLLADGFGSARALQQIAQGDTAAKQHQYAPVGIARHFFPAGDTEYHHGDCGGQRNHGIGIGNAESIFNLCAENPSKSGGDKNQHGNHAMQCPRDMLVFHFYPLAEIRAQNHIQRNQH